MSHAANRFYIIKGNKSIFKKFIFFMYCGLYYFIQPKKNNANNIFPFFPLVVRGIN